MLGSCVDEIARQSGGQNASDMCLEPPRLNVTAPNQPSPVVAGPLVEISAGRLLPQTGSNGRTCMLEIGAMCVIRPLSNTGFAVQHTS